MITFSYRITANLNDPNVSPLLHSAIYCLTPQEGKWPARLTTADPYFTKTARNGDLVLVVWGVASQYEPCYRVREIRQDQVSASLTMYVFTLDPLVGVTAPIEFATANPEFIARIKISDVLLVHLTIDKSGRLRLEQEYEQGG